MTEHRFTDVSQALPILADHLLGAGDEVGSRGGSRTLEALHQHIVLTSPTHREIVVPGRRASLPAQIAETVWILSGRNDVEWLSAYLPRAFDFSDDGETWRAGYGPRLRAWTDFSAPFDETVDQLAEVVRLLREDPSTRRAVMSIFDPSVDFADSKDIPCNNWLSFISRRGRLDLHVATRSNDLWWGWSGINSFEWSVLLEIVAGLVGVAVGELHFSITSLHLYDRHWKRAGEVATARDAAPPRLTSSPRFDPEVVGRDLGNLDALLQRWFAAEEEIRSGTFSSDSIDEFPEPMLRSWLRVLAWWWTKEERFLEPLRHTRLEQAARLTPSRTALPPIVEESPLRTAPALRLVEAPRPSEEDFSAATALLHAGKHEAYGDSWKRRGEILGIMANVARKIDRLGKNGGGDTAADTAADLLVYLAKYRLWLSENAGAPVPSCVKPVDLFTLTDTTPPVTDLLRWLANGPTLETITDGELEASLTGTFERLERAVLAAEKGTETPGARVALVDSMLGEAYVLAYRLWVYETLRTAS